MKVRATSTDRSPRLDPSRPYVERTVVLTPLARQLPPRRCLTPTNLHADLRSQLVREERRRIDAEACTKGLVAERDTLRDLLHHEEAQLSLAVAQAAGREQDWVLMRREWGKEAARREAAERQRDELTAAFVGKSQMTPSTPASPSRDRHVLHQQLMQETACMAEVLEEARAEMGSYARHTTLEARLSAQESQMEMLVLELDAAAPIMEAAEQQMETLRENCITYHERLKKEVQRKEEEEAAVRNLREQLRAESLRCEGAVEQGRSNLLAERRRLQQLHAAKDSDLAERCEELESCTREEKSLVLELREEVREARQDIVAQQFMTEGGLPLKDTLRRVEDAVAERDEEITALRSAFVEGRHVKEARLVAQVSVASWVRDAVRRINQRSSAWSSACSGSGPAFQPELAALRQECEALHLDLCLAEASQNQLRQEALRRSTATLRPPTSPTSSVSEDDLLPEESLGYEPTVSSRLQEREDEPRRQQPRGTAPQAKKHTLGQRLSPKEDSARPR